VTREAAGGASERKKHRGAGMENRAWRGGSKGGGVGENWSTRGGLEEGSPGSHRRGQPGAARHDTASSGTATARTGDARVCTAAGGAGSLMGGARMAGGGHEEDRRGARVGRS
jgi:hypothetical protein